MTNRYIGAALLTALSSYCISEMTLYPDSKYIYSDSFEDGTFAEDDEYFSWASRTSVIYISSVSQETGNTDFKGQSYLTDGFGGETSIIRENLKPLPIAEYGTIKPGATEKTNEHAMVVRYNASTPKKDTSWSEYHFDLGRPYKELWLRYWLRVPENYTHRDNGKASTNNKLLAIYTDKYSQQGKGATVVWEYWRKSNGGSTLAWHYRDVPTVTNTGHAQRFDFISTEDRGRWMQLVIHLKASSATGEADGVIETYRRWSDEDKFTRYHFSDTAYFSMPEKEEFSGWRQGYFMGWANAGWYEETRFMIDAVEFSETPLLDVTGVWEMVKPSASSLNPTYTTD